MPPILPDTAVVETHIVEMTNAYRAKKDLGQLSRNPALRKAAIAYAKFLATHKDLSHTADGKSPGDRVRQAGYQWCAIAENLALNLDSRGFESRRLAKETVEGWINSPGHRKNLVAPEMTETGVAVIRAPDKHPKYIAVQLFARPKSMEIAFQISNNTRQPVSYRFGDEKMELKGATGVMHSTCASDAISFEHVSLGSISETAADRAQASSGQFLPRNGMVYTIKEDQTGKLVMVATPRETID